MGAKVCKLGCKNNNKTNILWYAISIPFSYMIMTGEFHCTPNMNPINMDLLICTGVYLVILFAINVIALDYKYKRWLKILNRSAAIMILYFFFVMFFDLYDVFYWGKEKVCSVLGY